MVQKAPLSALPKKPIGKKVLHPLDIIKATVDREKTNEDPKHLYATLIKMSEQPNFRTVRANNSLFFMHNDGKGNADVRVFSTDKATEFAKNIIEFVKSLRVGGFKTIKLNLFEDGVLEHLKPFNLGFITEKSKGKTLHGAKKPVTIVGINLEPKQSNSTTRGT